MTSRRLKHGCTSSIHLSLSPLERTPIGYYYLMLVITGQTIKKGSVKMR